MTNAIETINWCNLIVTDSNNESCTLGEIANDDAADWSRMTMFKNDDGEWEGIDTWLDHFISAPGETPDWDTPKVPVDWTGFAEAIAR